MNCEIYTECSHGWFVPHCVRDDEGTCPFANDRDNHAADCRCAESQYFNGSIADTVAWLAALEKQT